MMTILQGTRQDLSQQLVEANVIPGSDFELLTA